MPTPAGRPRPSEPVATSTQGSRGVGWPSSLLPRARKLSSSSSPSTPAARYIAYSSGEAWPLEKISRSLPGWSGTVKS